MCGICGIFEFENRQDIPEAVVHRMNETICIAAQTTKGSMSARASVWDSGD